MTEIVVLLGVIPELAGDPHAAAPHRRVACPGGLHALVIDRALPERDEDTVGLAVMQAAILTAYAAHDDVVPVTLGALFSDDRALAAHIAADMARIESVRATISGAAEYVLSIEAPCSQPLRSASFSEGTGYLRRRQADIAKRRELQTSRRAFAAGVLEELSAQAARMASPRASKPSSLLSVSALLRRPSVGRTADAIAALAPDAAKLGLRLRMIGPCAPFSFVDVASTRA